MKRRTIDGIEFLQVPGSTPTFGWGPNHFTYQVFVEPGIRIRRRQFARTIDRILKDDRGWIRGGKVSFERVESNPNTLVVLAKPDAVDRLCYPLNTEGKVSCCVGPKVVINLQRWRYAVPHWTIGLQAYREMLVNHEFGHRTGQGHRYCSGPGNIAPVMMQATYGLQGCKENSWPLDSEL